MSATPTIIKIRDDQSGGFRSVRAFQVTTDANGPVYALAHCQVDANGNLSFDGGGLAASGSTPVTGSFTAVGGSASFTPLAGRPFNVFVWVDDPATWTATADAWIYLKRSFDNGANWFSLYSRWPGPNYLWDYNSPSASRTVSESEVGVIYALGCVKYNATVPIHYRISQ